MRQRMRNRFLVAAAVAALALVSSANLVRAQDCAGPALPESDPVAAKKVTLYPAFWNLVQVPAFSAINDDYTQAFVQICRSIGLPDGPVVLQIDAASGDYEMHTCNSDSTIQLATYRPCRGIAIWVNATAPMVVAILPSTMGVEGSWLYHSFGDTTGALWDNLFGVTLTIASVSPADLCLDLGLPANSAVTQINGATRALNTHLCTMSPTFDLVPGQSVLIRPVGTAGTLMGVGPVTID